MQLELRTARSAEVSELMRRGAAAIGMRYERDRSRELRFEELYREPLLVACAPDHPLAGRRVRSLRRLRDERWLAFPELPGQRELAAAHVFALFLAHGLGEVAWTPIDSLTAQKRLVEAGFGVARGHGTTARQLERSTDHDETMLPTGRSSGSCESKPAPIRRSLLVNELDVHSSGCSTVVPEVSPGSDMTEFP